MEKTAYSQLERGSDGLIRVVFYDTATSQPIDDLTGYRVVALDERGQTVPVNQIPVPTASTPIPTAQADVPRMDSQYESLLKQYEARANGGDPGEYNPGPLKGGLGVLNPKNWVSEAFGNDLAYTNDKTSNKVLQAGIGMAAGSLIGGPVGMVAGALAGGYVNSDKFKNQYNDRGQLNKVGVGMGQPKAPAQVGPTATADTDFSAGAQPTPDVNPVGGLLGETQTPGTQNIGQQRTNIPSNSPPIDGGYQGTDMRQAPSMAAFNRQEPTAPAKFDRTGLTPGIQNIVDKVGEAIPGVSVNSGFRSEAKNASVNGAKASQHLSGNAVDINTRGWSIDQKRDALEAAVQAGARGIGIYNSGNSLHVDARKTPAQWGPRGYTGSAISEMPEWSRDTLAAMHGAGPNGTVGPRLGPTPTPRDTAINMTSPVSREKLGPVGTNVTYDDTDLAFSSRPDFSNMSPGQLATSGFGGRPSQKQIDAMAYTLAGELDPSEMNNPQAVANLAATMNNRIQTAGLKATFDPTQYNSLSPRNRGVTQANYAKYGETLKQSLTDFYEGKNKPTTPDATHYYNPGFAQPDWGTKLTNTIQEGNHVIGNIPGEYQMKPEARQSLQKQVEDNYTNRALASQVGRNVDFTDKQLAGSPFSSFGMGTPKRESNLSEREKQAREQQEQQEAGSLAGSRYDDGSRRDTSRGFAGKDRDDRGVTSRSFSGKEKDDRGVGANSGRSSFSNSRAMSTRTKDDKDSDYGPGSLVGSRYDDGGSRGLGGRTSVSTTASKTFSGKDKDDRGVGLGSRSTSTKSGGLNTNNAKGMSTRSKDDNASSKSSSSKNSGSDRSVSKSVAEAKGNDRGNKKSGV